MHVCNVERLAGKHNRNVPQMYIFFKNVGVGMSLLTGKNITVFKVNNKGI